MTKITFIMYILPDVNPPLRQCLCKEYLELQQKHMPSRNALLYIYIYLFRSLCRVGWLYAKTSTLSHRLGSKPILCKR